MPLFAVLLGVALGDGEAKLSDVWSLIRQVVERALSHEFDAGDELGATLLRRLAVRYLNDGDFPPTAAVAPTLDARTRLLSTRLVVERDNRLEFPLLMLARWFGGEALAVGEVEVDSAVSDPDRASRWKDSIAMTLSRVPEPQADALFRPLVSASPGLAAQVLLDMPLQWPSSASRATAGLTSLEASALGYSLCAATRLWCEALPALGAQCSDLTELGELRPLLINTHGMSVTTAWYRGPSPFPAVWAGDVNSRRANWFHSTTQFEWNDGPLKRWRWGLQELAGDLTRALKARTLLSDETLRREDEYALARRLLDRRRWDSIDRAGLLSEIRRYPNTWGAPLTVVRGHDSISFEPDQIQEWDARLVDALEKGNAEMPWPQPGPDRIESILDRGFLTWEPYTPGRALELCEYVFNETIRIYETEVAGLLSPVRDCTRVLSAMPCSLLGLFHPPVYPGDAGDYPAPPWLDYWLMPSQFPSKARIVVDPVRGRSQSSRVQFASEQFGVAARDLEALPEVGRDLYWIYDERPVTHVVYEWLEKDLKEAAILKS